MNGTPHSTWNLWSDLWSTGNWWARRLLIGVVLWHLLTLSVGLIGVPMVTILFMVTVGSALTIVAIWYSQPLIPVLAAFTSGGRTAINWVAVVIGLELVLGMYLATVPVGINWTTRGLALLALGAALTALVLKISHTGWKLPITLLWLKFAVLTLVIYAYGLMPDMLSALHDGWMRGQTQAAEKIRRGESIWPTLAAAIQPRDKLEAFSQAQAVQPTSTQQVIQIPITTTWSDWIPIPGGAKFKLLVPGRIRIQFLNGKEREASPYDNIGIIPSNTFRIKSVGGTTGTAFVSYNF